MIQGKPRLSSSGALVGLSIDLEGGDLGLCQVGEGCRLY